MVNQDSNSPSAEVNQETPLPDFPLQRSYEEELQGLCDAWDRFYERVDARLGEISQ